MVGEIILGIFVVVVIKVVMIIAGIVLVDLVVGGIVVIMEGGFVAWWCWLLKSSE